MGRARARQSSGIGSRVQKGTHRRFPSQAPCARSLGLWLILVLALTNEDEEDE